MSVKISRTRVLRTGAPLTVEQIRVVAPAVFAEEPHKSRGPRYQYVPTIRPLEKLLNEGWGVWEASQQRARAADRDPYTKHMLRIRKLDHFNVGKSAVGNEGVPEVILINAHDGSAAYHCRAGFFRFICSNGMMVGTQLSGFKVYHTVGAKTAIDVLDAAERTVTERFPAMLDNIQRFREVSLPYELQTQFAEHALRLRYGDTMAPFPAHDLLQVRRDADKGDTLWAVLNRVQENIMAGGWETRSTMFSRRSTVRAVERVSAVTKINGGLWDKAAELAELVG